MKNVLLIIAIAFTGFTDASVSNDKYLQDNENYRMIRLNLFNTEGKYRNSYVSVICLNNYVFLKNEDDTALVQFFRKADSGTGSQPMTCDEVKRNKPHDKKGNRID